MDYIIEENGKYAHYFHHQTDGISRCYIRNGIIKERTSIYKNSASEFGLYYDGEKVHIVTSNNEELIYLCGTKDSWHRYILKKIPHDTKIQNIQLYSYKSRLNMIYTAKNKEGINLIHCILGNNQKPHLIAKLKTAKFNIFGNRVFYTLPDGACGFSEIKDSMVLPFVKTAECCDSLYFCENHIAFISNSKIYFDYKELCKDQFASDIILCSTPTGLFAVWKSRGGIRYINTDTSENRPHTIINSLTEPKLFTVFKNGKRLHIYGNCSGKELITYVNTSLFSTVNHNITDTVKTGLEELRKEIDELKKQLTALG